MNDPNDPNDSIPTDPPRPSPEDRCGAASPSGKACGLRRGHIEAGTPLHAGGGDVWANVGPGDDGWRPPSVREARLKPSKYVPHDFEPEEGDHRVAIGFTPAVVDLLKRQTEAAERQAIALEGIRQLVDHYVTQTLHTVRN